jgi:hypothetical protein
MLRSRRIFPSAVFFLSAISLVTLDGCGLYTPEKGLLQSDDVEPPNPSPQGMFEFTVAQHVMCEIRTGLWKAHFLSRQSAAWLEQLGAQVTLTLVVEDQSALNPNASFLQTFGLKGAESFTFGIGASGSANATRTETIQFTYPNKELWREALIDARHPEHNNCDTFQKGIMIDSNLKIGQFIYDKAVVANGIYGYGKQPFSQLQFTINFVASYSGNITPTWKFTTTTVNGSGTLLSATRTDTDTVIITLGQLTPDTKALHNAAVTASQTGQAVQSNTR